MKNRFLLTFLVLSFLAAPLLADEIKDFYDVWKIEFNVSPENANKNFTRKLGEFEKTKTFAVYQVQQPEIAEKLLELKKSLEVNYTKDTEGGGTDVEEFMSFYLAEREQILLQNQRYIFYVIFILVLMLFIVLLFVFYLILFYEKTRIAKEIFSELEKERSRISFELHDTAAQQIHGAILALQADESYDDAKKENLTSLLDSSQKEIRRICSALNPPSLEISPLEDLLKELCGSIKRNFGIDCNFYMDEKDLFEKRKLTNEQKLNIYRIVQESLTNAAKHSKADSVQVVFRGKSGSDKIVFFISDDGVSFDVKTSEKEGHFGLKSIKQRVGFLNGKLKITSEPEIGTEIRVEF